MASYDDDSASTEATIKSKNFSIADSGKYNIQNLYYPEGLSENIDMAHYMVFYFNIRGKSKFFLESNRLGEAPRVSNTTSPDAAKTIVTSGATVVGALAGAKLSKLIPGFDSKTAKGKALLSLGGAAAGGAVAYGATSQIETDKTYRISDCITLHINESPSASYGVKYSDGDIGTLLSLLSRPDSVIGSEGIAAGAALAANTFGNKNFNTALKKATGQSLNPFKEVLFESVDYRTFKFNYTFMPKSENESRSVKKIIDTFKFHMHPELSANSFFYIHPSEVNINYYFKGKENEWLNRITTCVITQVDVGYGSQKFSTFDNGAPVEINLSVTVREVEPLTKETIRSEGY